MAKIQAVWALDIGQAALKALKLVPGETPDQVVAEAFDFVEYPKILSQPDAEPEQLVREALATFLERNDLKGCKVAIAVPGQAGLVKFIKLPPVEKKRIPDIVKFEARQQIPFALEEVVWDYQQIGGDEAESDEDFTMAEVGLFAMKRDQINRAILPFKNAGIEVDIVQMSPIALYNFISFDKLKGSEGKDSVVLLDIGADNTDLIITDGTRIWQRNVPIGGNHFTRALTKELKLTFAKAEHLKRNATKAPDPRAIFTAMRGVFNDFASEINRSIGFYSSFNKTAKISKVVGLGNGFKLPGLQKFLQQNLGQDVEKLDGFARLVGDEVVGQPVFQDNIMSFAVAYGLAVQGLDRSGLHTNLLPPEIEQVRMIRAKKPWALAASALLMLGFSGLFLGQYRVLAKVSSPQFTTAVDEAKRVAKTGAEFKTGFATAKTAWIDKDKEGKALVGNAADRGMWPDFLKTLNAKLPDPVRDYKLDPTNPQDKPRIDLLQVHIDAIKPVWRENLDTDWFSDPQWLSDDFKPLLHPYDRATPPSGAGWIIQIIGHHYNPYPSSEELKLPEGKRTAYGPYGYLLQKVVPALLNPELRLYGIHHVSLSWMTSDKKWTSETGSKTGGLASNSVPIMPRATAPAATEGGGGGGDMSGMYANMMKGGMGGMGGGGGDMSGMMSGMYANMMKGGMGGMGGMRAAGEDATRKMYYLTRTDFLIRLVWQPLTPDDKAKLKDPAERQAKLEEFTKAMFEAQKASDVKIPTDIETKLEKASIQKSQVLDSAAQAALKNLAGAAAAGAAPVGAAPGGAAPVGAAPGGAAPAGAAPGGAAPPAGGPAPSK
jgi:type IV pilus assembly protein PilM